MRLRAALCAISMWLAVACGSDYDASPDDSGATAPAPDPTVSLPGAQTPAGGAPSGGGTPAQGVCPANDALLCQFAVILEQAAARGDAAAIAGRVQPGDEGVAWFSFGSDCCYVTAAEFELELAALFARADAAASDAEGGGGWRIYGIIQGATFWDGEPGIVLTAIFDDGQRYVVELGTARGSGGRRVSGAIYGSLAALFVPRGATLGRWGG